MNKLLVIVTGTDPSSRSGGIGYALPGYLRALGSATIAWTSIPTYHPSSFAGKWLPWLVAFPKLRNTIAKAHRQDEIVFVFSHAGSGSSLLRECFVLAFCRILGARTIMQLHAPEVHGYLEHPIKRSLFRLAIAPAMALGVLTPWWRRRLAPELSRKQLFVIPNPLPAAWEAAALTPRSNKVSDKRISLLSLSRLVPGKGIDLVVEALPHLPNTFELVIAGDGSLRESIGRRVAELGMTERVRFTGWVAGETKQRLFDEADIFVLPSRYDSFGMGFLEAMANGVPIVAAEWGAIPDVVPGERCGVLVREPTPGALAEAILRLNDPQLRSRMGLEGKRWVLEKFAPQEIGKEIRAMLEAVS